LSSQSAQLTGMMDPKLSNTGTLNNEMANAQDISSWWAEAFANPPTPSEERGHASGALEMLVIVAYDISDAKRLARVSKHCRDFGARLQYSIFECRLPADQFDRFWEELKTLIDPSEDRLMAYRICANCAQDIRLAGTQILPDVEPVAYVF